MSTALLSRRLVAGRGDVARQHPAGGLGQRHLLGTERLEEPHEARVRLGDAKERAHGASKRPDLPPSLNASRMSPITMPRSAACSMS